MAPTLLSYFGVPIPPDVQGHDLAATGATDQRVREAALFGSFGGHVNVTDGRYVYLRTCDRPDNKPLFDYTLMPTHMNSRYAPRELVGAKLVPPFGFTKNVPLLELAGQGMGNPHSFGCLLFDLEGDPRQINPLIDDELELRMMGLLVEQMRLNEAPASQFERLGLPAEGPVGPEHLQVRKLWTKVATSQQLPPAAESFASPHAGVLTPIRDLLADEASRAVVLKSLPFVEAPMFLKRNGGLSPWQLAVMMPSISASDLKGLHEQLISGKAAS